MIGPSHDRHVPDEQVPPGWTNRWTWYEYYSKWNMNYGDVAWYFNEVLHIPGKPRLVLISSDQYKDSEEGNRGDSELIEINGQFFFVTNREYDATQAIKGDCTLDEVLAGLRGEWPVDLVLEDCSVDWKAVDIYGNWYSRACEAREAIAGEIVY